MSYYEGYTEADNVKRKSNNIDDTGMQSMPRVKEYGGSGPSAAAKEAKVMKAKSKKNPIKVSVYENGELVMQYVTEDKR